MQKLRVFIASPEDVELERSLVSKTINLLQVEFADRVELEQVVWELEPMLATSSFQDQIDRPSSCDIAIFIFRTRFGTPLPPSYHRDDGSLYLSGTEYEFEEARESFLKTGTPRILVYRNRKGKLINVNDDDFDNIGEQRRALDEFTRKWFIDEADNTFKGAFYQFKTSDEFERLVGSHLLKLISQLAPGQLIHGESSYRMWHRGNPFVGLNSFEYRHSAVYFGRTRAISDCVRSLEDAESVGCPFLLVLGMSGGGKSSLVHAGILPTLIQKDVIEGIILSKWVSMQPSDMDGKLFQRLIIALTDEKILPSLSVYGSEDLISMAMEEPEEFAQLVADNIYKDSESPSADERLVLVVDQFEELFTSSYIAEDDRYRFTRLLEHLVRDANIWCIITIRSDYYPTLTADPCLAALKTDGAQYDLKVPTPEEISQMIRAPAIAAGLHYEKHPDTGEALEETIRQAAESNPEILPLLEYTLSELYEQKSKDGFLTYAAYKELGGVEGALALTAERCFGKLSANEQETLPYVFNALIEFTSEGNIGRRWASLDSIENEKTKAFIESFVDTRHVRAFIDALVTARLFVIELDSQQQQIVTVTHESLFLHWPRLNEWVENNKDQLRVRSRLGAASELWRESDQSTDLLLSTGKPAEEAKMLVDSGLSLTDTTQQFIAASFSRLQRNRWFRYSGFALVFLFAIVAGVAAYLANVSNQDSLRRLAQNDDLVTFMLDDLIEQLRPIGRLEPIRIVGEKAINYFEGIDDEDRTDVARLKHAQALHQVGEIYFRAGEFGEANEAFSESLRQAKILYDLDPQDTDREYELGQAYYWVAYSNLNYEKLDEAKGYLLWYLEVSESLVAKDPENVDWQMELGFAYGSNGALEDARQNYKLALDYFKSATQVFTALTESFPERQEIARELAGNYSWMGTMYRYMGDLQQSQSYFLREEEITRRLVTTSNDADWRYSMMHVHRHLGELYIDTGKLDDARSRFHLGLIIVDELVAGDDQDTRWIYGQALCNYYLAQIGIYLGEYSEAQESMDKAMAAVDRLLKMDDPITDWRILEIRGLLLLAMLNYEDGEVTIANDLAGTASENAYALLAENPDNLEVRKLALKARIALATHHENESETARELEPASKLINSEMLTSDRPDVLVAMLRFYAYQGDEYENMIAYRDKLQKFGINHPEVNRILSTGNN